MSSRGQQRLIGKVNPWGKLEGAQVEHLWNWITNLTKANKKKMIEGKGNNVGKA
jgi:hypothetical protein